MLSRTLSTWQLCFLHRSAYVWASGLWRRRTCCTSCRQTPASSCATLPGSIQRNRMVWARALRRATVLGLEVNWNVPLPARPTRPLWTVVEWKYTDTQSSAGKNTSLYYNRFKYWTKPAGGRRLFTYCLAEDNLPQVITHTFKKKKKLDSQPMEIYMEIVAASE